MLGIQIVVNSRHPVVDIIAVHGLDGSSDNSWTDPQTKISWLTESTLLPGAISNARILTFGYDVNTVVAQPSSATLTEHADSLLESLSRIRRETNAIGRPLIFIAHSLGGIVVKEALVRSRLKASLDCQDLRESTKGVLFFGTPHLGSDWSKLHATILRISKLFKSTTAHIAIQLAKNSKYLIDLQSQFSLFSQTFVTVYFYEELGTPIGFRTVVLVPRESAVPFADLNAIKLHKDHVTMVKFTSPADDDYLKVVSHLRNIMSEASVAKAEISLEQMQSCEKKKQDILDWMNATITSSHHRDARKRHREGTGLWFLQDSRFLRWVHMRNSFFWTYGKSGCGKTVFLSSMLEHVLNVCRHDTQCATAYHYCNFRDNSQLHCGDLIASFVDQMLRQASFVPETLEQLYDGRNRDPHASRCTELLMEPLKELMSSFKEVFLLVDALDEFAGSETEELMDILSTIMEWGVPSLHVLVTSQFHRIDIRAPLETLAPPNYRLDLAKASLHIQDDIRTHINKSLEESPKFCQRWVGDTGYILLEIEDALSKKSEGSFRWVECQIRALATCKTVNEIRKALSSLPRDLSETYSRIIGRLDAADAAAASKVLVWLALARRPLTIEELAVILSEDQNSCFDVRNQPALVDIVQLCQDLTVLKKDAVRTPSVVWDYETDEDTDEDATASMWPSPDIDHPPASAQGAGTSTSFIVSGHFQVHGGESLVLAHSSVRDWLMEPSSGNKPSIADPSMWHAELAVTTISFVLHPRLSSTFWDYSASECLVHAEMGPSETVKKLTLTLLDDKSEHFHTWSNFHRRGTYNELGASVAGPMYYASIFDLHWAIQALADSGYHVNSFGGFFEYPLLAATSVCLGNSRTVEQLLSAGADPAVQASKPFSIYIPDVNNFMDVQNTDQDNDPDVIACSSIRHNWIPSCALEIAAGCGYDKVVRLLLNAGTHRSIDDALWIAAANGHTSAIQMLLNAGADINAISRKYSTTSITVAASRGQLSIVQLLLHAGANPNGSVGEKFSPLFHAAGKGYLEVVELLLRFGGNPDLSADEDNNPLRAAGASVLKLDDVKAEWMTGQRLSRDAMLAKQAAVMRALLGCPVGMHLSSGKGDRALFIASQYGWVDVVERLLAAGANPNASVQGRTTALQVACETNHREIVTHLLAAGASANALDEYGRRALTVAVQQREPQIVDDLLKHGADPNTADQSYDSVLRLAAFSGCSSHIVERLLDAGADCNASGGSYGSALQAAAASEGHARYEIARVLLARGADVDAKYGEYQYGTALQIASWRHDWETVVLLLQQGADPNVTGGIHGSALQRASTSYDSFGIIATLHAAGADVNALGGTFGSALHAAAYQGIVENVRMLLTAGADVNVVDKESGSALHMALKWGNQAIVDLLQEAGARDIEPPLAPQSSAESSEHTIAPASTSTAYYSFDPMTPPGAPRPERWVEPLRAQPRIADNKAKGYVLPSSRPFWRAFKPDPKVESGPGRTSSHTGASTEHEQMLQVWNVSTEDR